jgi:hypothetical protein
VTPEHQQFLKRLADSRPAVHAVADWLRARGESVIVPETRYAPSADVHEQYADNGDLFLSRGRIVEVKQISRCFYFPSDWPFGHEFFIDTTERIEYFADKRVSWIIVSADYAAIGIVLPETKPNWYVTKATSRFTGKEKRYTAVATEHVIFRPFGQRWNRYER